MQSRALSLWLGLAVVVWLCAAATGLAIVWRFDNAPGPAAVAPVRWPVESQLTRATERPTLVLLAHPQCSCTVATLDELAEVLARSEAPPQTYVVFLDPAGVGRDWVESDLWKKASRIRDVSVVADRDGREARWFGAATSGQTLLYDAQGALVFNGGITAARAHAGDNAGRQTLISLLNHVSSHGDRTSVFGCPLFNHDGA